jgi:hypothetical protein
MRSVLDALDALALALTTHGHVWTSGERQLYEDAVAALSDAEGDYTGSGLSASQTH